jgi:hypothetical protein
MLIAEEFLYTFLEAWHARTISTLTCFRDASELIMDDQLYLGSDCITRLASETSQLNPTFVEVMPSKEGFDIGIALNGDIKVRVSLVNRFEKPRNIVSDSFEPIHRVNKVKHRHFIELRPGDCSPQ